SGGGCTMQPGIAAAPPGSDPVREVFDRLRAGLDAKTYEHWIDGKVALSARDDELTVGVGSPFLLAWMQRQFTAAFRTAAREVLGASARLRFVVDGRVGLPNIRVGNSSGVAASRSEAARTPAAPAAEAVPVKANVAPRPARPEARRYADLAEFVAGPNSELAYAAALRLCEHPAAFAGPLYVYGGVGLGKTHLLEGVARRLRGQAGAGQVAYFTAEAFANYFTEALRGRTLPAFRNRFRGVDVLLVDDVDFLDGKRGLQEEFLHTLQHLESRGRTIVLAADRHPKLLTRTAEELVTRFLAGTVCRLEPPDYETRLRILDRKASRLPDAPSRPVLDWIARRFRGGVRELEGALNCLGVYREMSGRPVGLAAARQILGDLERDCLRAIRLPDIERAVCEFFGVEPNDLRSPNRSRSVSQPRMLAMYLARKHTQAAYGEIGAHFGGRNHSTVIAAERKVRQLLDGASAWTVAAESMPLGDLVRSIESRLRAC
ncbi:MAG TPA: chromosomal replication initiator protein DnaA, partial [Planctomycetaceae bacterium]